MGIIILEETTKNPITLMGQRAGVCWGADVKNFEKNYKRGLDCLESGHGRVMEYVNVEMIIDGYSARVIREWYTHLGGAPTRLQASTRYINYEDFKYILPHTIRKNPEAKAVYELMMKNIADSCSKLEKEFGIPREDAAMLLPLGMETKIVDKRNLRNLVDMSHQRMCSRAFWEYRELMKDICDALRAYSQEWAYLVDNYFMPKCEAVGYCTEKKSCGRKAPRNTGSDSPRIDIDLSEYFTEDESVSTKNDSKPASFYEEEACVNKQNDKMSEESFLPITDVMTKNPRTDIKKTTETEVFFDEDDE